MMTPARATVLNVFAEEWDQHGDHPGYTWDRTSVGERLGGELLGASLYQLPPGQQSWPYHHHYANEELLIVLDGSPTLRAPEGERRLRAGDTAIFRRGRQGAHKVINRSRRPARFLIISAMIHPDIGHHVDSNMIGVFAGAPPVPGHTAPLELVYRLDDATNYPETDDPDQRLG
jgi:uncharacterized cupin superfamily protein